MTSTNLTERLDAAVDARADLFEPRHECAFRLFYGFVEGCPQISVDLYGATAVVHDYGERAGAPPGLASAAVEHLRARLPWLRAIVLKTRNAPDPVARRGRLVWGEGWDHKIREHGVWYAVDPFLNLDASLYLDTAMLRGWARRELGGAAVLNVFAYTGSLGVAAKAGGARRVLHVDLNRRFLNVGKSSYALNGFPIAKGDFVAGDFWKVVNELKRRGDLFDCVVVDPPFFSATSSGRVDLVGAYHRVINKVRPLVAHGGRLVAINNALFVSGAEYSRTLEGLCADGYLAIEELVPVPEHSTGYPSTRVGAEPTDPSPFNHSTKIAVLRVRRKDERTAA